MGNIVLILYSLGAIALMLYGAKEDIKTAVEKYIYEPFSETSELSLGVLTLYAVFFLALILLLIFINIQQLSLH